MIKQVNSEFEVLQGTGKGNFQMYYHQACFQKYILNNDNVCALYIQKMEQMREIKKAIKNQYSE